MLQESSFIYFHYFFSCYTCDKNALKFDVSTTLKGYSIHWYDVMPPVSGLFPVQKKDKHIQYINMASI